MCSKTKNARNEKMIWYNEQNASCYVPLGSHFKCTIGINRMPRDYSGPVLNTDNS